ncbi:DUF1796 family putative cysteine peptidase [Caulobacter sp. DWR2-3-1b2]|uniref:DUF1796 family putative cysteine peptidase n=1 Tax=unclassified Caulobacter TaxID=2648921 RepID=UPI003CECAF95
MQFLSVGGYCQVAHQIQRYTGCKTSSPFDWLVSPIDGTIKIIEDDGEGLARDVKTRSNGKSAICARYGVSYHHEFIRDKDGLVVFSVEALLSTRAKLLHKLRNFRAQARMGPVTFIRFGTFAHSADANPYLADEPMPFSKLNALAVALEAMSRDFRLAVVNHDSIWPLHADVALDERIDLHRIEVSESGTWEGDDAQWDAILGQYAPRPDKARKVRGAYVRQEA